MKVCIIGASGKLGQYMLRHCLDRSYEVVGVCRARSVEKLDAYKDRIRIEPGFTNDREVIKRAVKGRDRILPVLAPSRKRIKPTTDGLYSSQGALDQLNTNFRRQR